MSTVRSCAETAVANGSGDVPGRASFLGEDVYTHIHGDYAEDTLRGRMFAYGVASQALLLTNTTGNVPTIWNPSGSNTIFVPVAVVLSFISGATTIGAVNWAVTRNAGATIGATAPIITFTAAAAVNCAIGSTSPRASAMFFAPSVCTFTAAPAYLCGTGINFGTNAPTGTGTYEAPQNGRVVLYPGAALSLVYTVTTSTSVFATTIYGLELPIPVGV